MTAFSEILQLAADHLDRINQNRERYVEAWIAETGLKPSEAEIVEESFTTATGFQTRITVRRRQTESLRRDRDELLEALERWVPKYEPCYCATLKEPPCLLCHDRALLARIKGTP